MQQAMAALPFAVGLEESLWTARFLVGTGRPCAGALAGAWVDKEEAGMKRRLTWLGVLPLSAVLAALLVLVVAVCSFLGAAWLKGDSYLPASPIQEQEQQAR
jgi:hypothetical protein